MIKNTIEYYSDTANSWAERWYNKDTFVPYLIQFMSLFPSKPKIIELCCGTGYDSMRLRKMGASVIGLDLSPGALSIAKEKNPEICFYLQDIRQDYSYVGEADGILCCAGLIHLCNEELELAFKQMSKVVKKGGFVFIVVFDGIGQRLDWQYITINNVTYDRIFFRHTLSELITYSRNYFDFKIEFNHDDDDRWRYYIFERK